MLFSFPLGVPKAPLRPLGNDSSLPCLSPDLDGVQLFRIHCQAAAVVCVCAYVLGLLSFPLGVPKVPLRPLGNDRFLLCLSPDLDGVQPFRIHCQAAAVVCVCAYVLGLLSFPLGVPKVPLRPLGNDRFLLCLSPDLDGVQPFRIHSQAAAVVCVCAYVLGLLSFPLGVPKVPLRPLGNDRFLLCLSPDLDGVQPFRIVFCFA